MTFNVSTFLFQVVNFAALAFVLHRLLYRPIRKAIEQRQADNLRARNEAEQARQEAGAAREELRKRLREFAEQREAMVRDAQKQTEAMRAKRLAEAEQEADAVRQRARQDVEALRTEAFQSWSSEVESLAIGLAERLLREAAGTSITHQLTVRLAETLERLPETDRRQIRQDMSPGGMAVLEVAQEIDDGARQQLVDAVCKLRETSGELRIETAPNLIAGARLRLDGHIWDASIAGQIAAARNGPEVSTT
jgi:F-type H+-transporting ATPase subunit b